MAVLHLPRERYCRIMTVIDDRRGMTDEFAVEDLSTGIFASGYGRAEGGRSFSFHIEHGTLVVEVYRPRVSSPVPQAEDIIGTSMRGVADIDLTDARSLTAAVRDCVAHAVAAVR